jgi:hypothetical protein
MDRSTVDRSTALDPYKFRSPTEAEAALVSIFGNAFPRPSSGVDEWWWTTIAVFRFVVFPYSEHSLS